MTEKRERWQNKECYGKTKSRWQQPAREDGGQSSHDTWTNSQHQGQWKEISGDFDAVENTVEEKTNTWNKSCLESVKREKELYNLVEAAVMDENKQQERGMIRDLMEQLQKKREEEDETNGLIEEMQRNVEDAQHRSYEGKRKLDRVLWEYIEAFDKEMGRPQLSMTKRWQIMQSRDTQNLN